MNVLEKIFQAAAGFLEEVIERREEFGLTRELAGYPTFRIVNLVKFSDHTSPIQVSRRCLA